MHFSSLPWTKLGEAWRQNEQVQITIFPSQLFLSKTSIYWIHLVQWSLGFRGISLFALQERERRSTKRFSKFAERDAKRNARDLYENGSQILNNCGLQKNYKSMRWFSTFIQTEMQERERELLKKWHHFSLNLPQVRNEEEEKNIERIY